MHYQGDLLGQGPVWGYVEGGMGRISFAIAEAARDLGAVLAAGVPVAEILPGEGVRLEGGDLIRAKVVVSNADPKRALGMLGPDAVPDAFRARLEAWQIRSPVVKFNAALDRLPTFTAAPGESLPYRSMITVTHGMEAAQARVRRAARRASRRSASARSTSRPATTRRRHPRASTSSACSASTAPTSWPRATWDSRRAEVQQQFVDLIEDFAPDFGDCIAHAEVLGPPDIEARVGLTGGHIFQGETMPDQMWEHRLTPRTPIDGFYFCGAATHPAGSVIGLNGRNAADAVLADTAE